MYGPSYFTNQPIFGGSVLSESNSWCGGLIDWNTIKDLDPIAIKSRKDTISVQKIINIFQKASISSEDAGFFNHPLAPRLFQLLQVSINYLVSSKNNLTTKLEAKTKECKNATRKLQKVESAYKKLETNCKKFEEGYIKAAHLVEQLKQPRESCPACGKKFLNAEYLDKHFAANHENLLNAWNAIRTQTPIGNQDDIKLLINEIKTIKKSRHHKKYESDYSEEGTFCDTETMERSYKRHKSMKRSKSDQQRTKYYPEVINTANPFHNPNPKPILQMTRGDTVMINQKQYIPQTIVIDEIIPSPPTIHRVNSTPDSNTIQKAKKFVVTRKNQEKPKIDDDKMEQMIDTVSQRIQVQIQEEMENNRTSEFTPHIHDSSIAEYDEQSVEEGEIIEEEEEEYEEEEAPPPPPPKKKSHSPKKNNSNKEVEIEEPKPIIVESVHVIMKEPIKIEQEPPMDVPLTVTFKPLPNAPPNIKPARKIDPPTPLPQEYEIEHDPFAITTESQNFGEFVLNSTVEEPIKKHEQVTITNSELADLLGEEEEEQNENTNQVSVRMTETPERGVAITNSELNDLLGESYCEEEAQQHSDHNQYYNDQPLTNSELNDLLGENSDYYEPSPQVQKSLPKPAKFIQTFNPKDKFDLSYLNDIPGPDTSIRQQNFDPQMQNSIQPKKSILGEPKKTRRLLMFTED